MFAFFVIIRYVLRIVWMYDLAERLETQYPSSISCFEIIISYIFRLDTHFFFRCNRKCTREFCDMCVHCVFIKRRIYWTAACMYWIRIFYTYKYVSGEFIGSSSTLLSPKILFFFYLLFWRDFFGVFLSNECCSILWWNECVIPKNVVVCRRILSIGTVLLF